MQVKIIGGAEKKKAWKNQTFFDAYYSEAYFFSSSKFWKEYAKPRLNAWLSCAPLS